MYSQRPSFPGPDFPGQGLSNALSNGLLADKFFPGRIVPVLGLDAGLFRPFVAYGLLDSGLTIHLAAVINFRSIPTGPGLKTMAYFKVSNFELRGRAAPCIEDSAKIRWCMMNQWDEQLRCPKCRNTGTASLSQGDQETSVVQDVAEGFKAVKTRYGPAFYCAGCDISTDIG